LNDIAAVSPTTVLNGALLQFDIFLNDNSVDYGLSPSAVFIDLNAPVQRGGFAEGDILEGISEVIGSGGNDVIRGSNVIDYPPDPAPIFVNGRSVQDSFRFTIDKNSGEDILVGGNGDDVLEGRGGADILVGGSLTATLDLGFDFASYESSPAAVTVRLSGFGTDTTPGIASGGDATGDTLISIEGLIGSAFDDALTGNSGDNILVGGLGNDVLDGRDGIDTADYSQDHVIAFIPIVDRVDVHLGLNNAAARRRRIRAPCLPRCRIGSASSPGPCASSRWRDAY
jgi:Ca2+-binding RTX toxin-like protein